jgi:hypothetical protein
MSYIPFGSADPSRVPWPPAGCGSKTRPAETRISGRSGVAMQRADAAGRTGEEDECHLSARHGVQARLLPRGALRGRGARQAGVRSDGRDRHRVLHNVALSARQRLEDLLARRTTTTSQHMRNEQACERAVRVCVCVCGSGARAALRACGSICRSCASSASRSSASHASQNWNTCACASQTRSSVAISTQHEATETRRMRAQRWRGTRLLR